MIYVYEGVSNNVMLWSCMVCTMSFIQCVRVEQLQVLSAACREHRGGTSSLTADVLLIMARVGRLSLQLPLPIKNLLLQVYMIDIMTVYLQLQ